MKVTQYKILSVEAWPYDGSWQWNDWHTVGSIASNEIPESNRKLLRYFRDQGYLTKGSAGRVAVNDDGYNIVITERNGKPLYAIEYGCHI